MGLWYKAQLIHELIVFTAANWSEGLAQLKVTTNNDVTEDVLDHLTSHVDWIRGVLVSYVDPEPLQEPKLPLTYVIAFSGKRTDASSDEAALYSTSQDNQLPTSSSPPSQGDQKTPPFESLLNKVTHVVCLISFAFIDV